MDVDKNVHDTRSLQETLDKNVRMSSKFEIGQFVYIIKPLRAVLAFEAIKVATASYNKLMARVSNPKEIVTVRDNILTILEGCIYYTISIYRVTYTHGLYKRHQINADKDKILNKQPLNQNNQTLQSESSAHVVDRIIRHIVQDGVAKHMLRWYGYPLRSIP